MASPDAQAVPVTASLYEISLPDANGYTTAESKTYRFATHYTTEVFETTVPWPVRVDLPALTARRARAMRRG
jgi:hypothetical protein